MTDNLLTAATLAQDEFDQAEALQISLLRESYPSLDLRRGTALRDLLLRPVSAVYALETLRNAELLRTRSLADMLANPGADDTDAINAVLSNFNTALRPGRPARGLLKVTVTNPGTYRLPVGTAFTAPGGTVFTSVSAVEASGANSQLRGPDEDGRLYFTLSVQATEGAEAAPRAGTAFTVQSVFSGYVGAVAYSDFDSGAAAETLAQAVMRLPSTVSARGMITPAAISATLVDPVTGPFPGAVFEVAVQGAGDPAQWRDRRNMHGVALGGRIDVYVRTFHGLPVLSRILTGTRVGAGDYVIAVSRDVAPGYYAIKSVTSEDAAIAGVDQPVSFVTIGSYAFDEVRYRDTADAPDGRFSDADPVTGTVYQAADITVRGVEPADSPTKLFKVEFYAAPLLSGLQDYVDRSDVRNAAADTLIRGPFICALNMRIPVRVRAGVTLDTDAIKAAIVAAVDRKPFGSTFTVSEVLAVVHAFPIESADTAPARKGGFMLEGVVKDGAGTEHVLSGATIDVSDINDPSGLLHRETCVLATDASRIVIEVRTA